MEGLKNKNDFTIIFFQKREGETDKLRLKMPFVHRIETAIKWLEKQGIQWDYANVYIRRTRQFYKQIKK